MNILITSHFFNPHIGGIETITENLANEFVRMGHRVIIITRTSLVNNEIIQFPYPVLRNPSAKEIYNAYKWCDIFVHSAISLKWIWPLFIKKKPWVIIYHGVSYKKGWKGKLKKVCSHFSFNIAVSNTCRKGHGLRNATVIYNSYNESIFKKDNNCLRKNFVSVGAVTLGKGCNVLLEAFEKFKKETNSDYKLYIVGDSEERIKLEKQASLLPSGHDIIFTGRKSQKEVASILNENRISIIPSKYPEAFGIVSLESLACGCIVIGSNKDGIEEALGGCGITFEKGDINDLSLKMKEAYNYTEQDYLIMRNKAKKHLEELSLHNIAKQYISFFSRCMNK